MAFVGDLWLAIVIGTIVLWLMSFIAWVILPHQYGDHLPMWPARRAMLRPIFSRSSAWPAPSESWSSPAAACSTASGSCGGCGPAFSTAWPTAWWSD